MIPYHDATHFKVGVYQTHGKNVKNFQVVPGSQRRSIVGYIAPNNVTTTEDIVSDFGQCPCRSVSMMTAGQEGMMPTLECSGREGR